MHRRSEINLSLVTIAFTKITILNMSYCCLHIFWVILHIFTFAFVRRCWSLYLGETFRDFFFLFAKSNYACFYAVYSKPTEIVHWLVNILFNVIYRCVVQTIIFSAFLIFKHISLNIMIQTIWYLHLLMGTNYFYR